MSDNKEDSAPKYVFREQGDIVVPHRMIMGTALHELRPKCYEVVIISKDGDLGLREIEQVKPPEKIYGNCHKDVDRYFRTFARNDGNTGVQLIGQKGSGKTMTLRVMTQTSLTMGMPVIFVNRELPEYQFAVLMSSIEQDCMVAFDEFDKTHSKPLRDNDGDLSDNADTSSQNSLLTVLDGSVGGGKKLFVFVANEAYAISPYMTNRPSRVRYRKIFDLLPENVMVPYLRDNLKGATDLEIYHFLKLKSYAGAENFNFDMMAAIVDEKNHYGGTVLENATIMFGRDLVRGFNTPVTVEITLPGGEKYKLAGEETFNSSAGTSLVSVMIRPSDQKKKLRGITAYVNEENFVRGEDDFASLIFEEAGVTFKVMRVAMASDMEMKDFKGSKISDGAFVDKDQVKHSMHVQTDPDYVAFVEAWKAMINLVDPPVEEVAVEGTTANFPQADRVNKLDPQPTEAEQVVEHPYSVMLPIAFDGGRNDNVTFGKGVSGRGPLDWTFQITETDRSSIGLGVIDSMNISRGAGDLSTSGNKLYADAPEQREGHAPNILGDRLRSMLELTTGIMRRHVFATRGPAFSEASEVPGPDKSGIVEDRPRDPYIGKRRPYYQLIAEPTDKPIEFGNGIISNMKVPGTDGSSGEAGGSSSK